MGGVTTEAETAAPDDLFARLKGWVTSAEGKLDTWRTDAKRWYGMVDDTQWSDDDKATIQGEGRVPVEFNRMGPIVDVICGLEINNRQETIYLPRTQGDVEKNELLTSTADWARDTCQAADEESDAFRDLVICGVGATETRMSYDIDPMGRIVEERVDACGEMGWDPASTKQNLVDRRFAYRFRNLPAETAEAMFPGITVAELHCTWMANAAQVKDGGDGDKRDYPDETRPGLEGGTRPKEVCLVEIEWWEPVPVVFVAEPGQPKPQELTPADWEKLSKRLTTAGQPLPRAVKSTKRRWMHAVLGRAGIVGEPVERKEPQFRFMTGKRNRNKNSWYGAVKPMCDPQMMANVALSLVVAILRSNAKGGVMAEEGAFVDQAKAERDWADPAKVIHLTQGGLDKIKERTPSQIPTAVNQLLEFAIGSIPDVTGVNVEMMGLADRDQPASLEYQRRQSAVTILASLFNALRRFRIEQGRTLLAMIAMLTPGTLVRITVDDEETGEQKQQYVPFDPATFRLNEDDMLYDVIVDEAPSSPNQQQMTWATISDLLSKGMQLPPSAIADTLEYAPLPKSVAKKLADGIRQATGAVIPPELQQQMEMMGQALEQANGVIADKDAQLRQAAASTERDRLQLDRDKIALDRMKIAVDAWKSGVMITPEGQLMSVRQPANEGGIIQ